MARRALAGRQRFGQVVGIAGWKNAGKTTLTERLVAELAARGHTVSTVKHAHHDFDIDHAGTDSQRHRAAGAQEVAVVSSACWAFIRDLRGAPEPPFAAVIGSLAPADIVLVEGYKRENHRKIELRRGGEACPAAPEFANVVAIATDRPDIAAPVPVFALDDIVALADFVEGLCRR
ncbi:MAG: molybdopterin-guanine dinucleotide biosynthesis protein B [Rhizobiaceae bacterium]|nr:molybdopterin-guanine dinucleotide biosynthesis protein B [Rhizobiaceae bacterium]